jgi:hypothetical protein
MYNPIPPTSTGEKKREENQATGQKIKESYDKGNMNPKARYKSRRNVKPKNREMVSPKTE